MPITREYVHKIFEHAKNHEQAEISNLLSPLVAIPINLIIKKLNPHSEASVVELRSEAFGRRTDEDYVNFVCMILEFDDQEEPKVKKFHEYLDSAHLQAFYEKNKD
ncbi:hypothetical protein V865_007744 [Kwoniella europaea PYCC6329]|uniref:Uncharacterized protein n=1 Tax=Kwoniella europaea PYCC6329 TaxID=1423913 RepID=A0AAX4KT20_9TREE